MATATLKCCGCKCRFDAKTMIKLPAGNFHSIDCATEYAQRRQEKQRATQANREKKARAQKKSAFRQNDVKTRKAAAKLWCHLYIRTRDKDKPCICCGRPLEEGFHAGHYLESGNNPKIRYDEANIHGQNLNCNYFKGGDSGDYEANLTERVGVEKVQALKAAKGGTMRRTAQDYREIEDYYRAKLREHADSCITVI